MVFGTVTIWAGFCSQSGNTDESNDDDDGDGYGDTDDKINCNLGPVAIHVQYNITALIYLMSSVYQQTGKAYLHSGEMLSNNIKARIKYELL